MKRSKFFDAEHRLMGEHPVPDHWPLVIITPRTRKTVRVFVRSHEGYVETGAWWGVKVSADR